MDMARLSDEEKHVEQNSHTMYSTPCRASSRQFFNSSRTIIDWFNGDGSMRLNLHSSEPSTWSLFNFGF